MSDPPATSGFPRAEFGALLRRLPSYGRLAWTLARDPRLSRARRLAVLAGAAYVISPIDLVPGIIPVAGQLDDLAVALAAIRIALDGLKPEARAERLASAGLSQADLEADLRATRAIAAWMARSAVRVGHEATSAALDATATVGRGLLQAGRAVEARLQRARSGRPER